MPDFSQPGKDGELPTGVAEWRDGVGELMTTGLIYTARGARTVLPCDRTYRISAIFKQKAPKSITFSRYADVYRRVARLASSRTAEMSCAHGEPLHSRILGQTWMCISGSTHDFPMAGLVVELSCFRGTRATGESAPTLDALTIPGGMPPTEFSRVASEPSEEIYNEYDVSESQAEPLSFSYGEHVESCSGIDYGPFVERAENRARFHHQVLASLSGAAKLPFAIWRRHWFAASDTLVVVVVYWTSADA